MKIKSILTSLVLLLGVVNFANAASVSLTPAAVEAEVGDVVALDVVWTFQDDPTLGGGFDMAYDPSKLAFVSYDFSGDPAFDAGFNRAPDLSPGLLAGIAGGNFNGVSGPVVHGTVTFQVIGGEGTVTSVTPSDTSNLAVGPFVSAATFTPQSVEFSSAEITVVPLPAAAWLLGSALFGLVVLKRKKA